MSSHGLRAALDAALAQLRSKEAGLVSNECIQPPVHGDHNTETRLANFEELRQRCAVEAAAWNDEACRWRRQRAEIAGALVCTAAHALAQSTGLLQPGDLPADLAVDRFSIHEEEEADSDARAAHATEQRLDALQATELLASEAGFTASSLLADLADRQLEVNAAVSEAIERAQWLAATAERQRAVAALCNERHQAFAAKWLRKIEAVATSAPPTAPAASSWPTAGGVMVTDAPPAPRIQIHVDAETISNEDLTWHGGPRSLTSEGEGAAAPLVLEVFRRRALPTAGALPTEHDASELELEVVR
jgi:hypothetical protein